MKEEINVKEATIPVTIRIPILALASVNKSQNTNVKDNLLPLGGSKNHYYS